MKIFVKTLCIGACLVILKSPFSFWPMREIYCDSFSEAIKGKLIEASNWKDLNPETLNYFSLLDQRSSLILTARLINGYSIKNCFDGLRDQTIKIPNISKLTIHQIKFKATYNNNLDRLIECIPYIDDGTKNIELNKLKQDLLNFYENEMIDKVLSNLKFLNCDFKYDENFWEEENLRSISSYVFLSFSKPILSIDENGLIKKVSEDKIQDNSVNLFRTFKSWSSVEINNESDRVILTQVYNGRAKQVDLKTALQSYWKEKFDTSVDNLGKILTTHFIQRPDREKPYFNRKIINDTIAQYDTNESILCCLKNSTILALWCLVPDLKDRSIQTQMVGLARDNKTQKLFHWTTELDGDVSLLMKYAKEVVQS